jgi:hypothetical protein
MPRPVRPAEPPPLKTVAPVRTPERAPATPASNADQNLAEMAQRLEAALRRPSGNGNGEAKPEGADRAPPVAPEAAPARPARAPTTEAAPAVENVSPEAPRAPFKNLEEEMASLLGRPKNPT